MPSSSVVIKLWGGVVDDMKIWMETMMNEHTVLINGQYQATCHDFLALRSSSVSLNGVLSSSRHQTPPRRVVWRHRVFITNDWPSN